MQKLCVLGLGYIGLPTASMFATHGYQVVGVDVNDRIISRLNAGGIHIEEPGLETMVQAGLKSGSLRVQTMPEPADAFIIAVPTPITADKKADLRYVESAARAILPHLKKGNLVILESTSPPKTTQEVLAPILAQSGLDPYRDLLVAHSPERVLPGRILQELMGNDRVVGGLTPAAAEATRDLYAGFVQGTIFLTDATTAETVKLMENTYRDVNIALANEFALIAESLGVNTWEATEIANRHPRVNILQPGPGVGGHCIAIDPWFLVQSAPDLTQLITTARHINDHMPQFVVELVQSVLTSVKKPVVAALGLAYKANVDDTRESPSVTVIRLLQSIGYEVRAYDPYVKNSPVMGASSSLDEAVTGADCLLLLTNHRQFESVVPIEIGKKMRHRKLIDTRKALRHADWREAGFEVYLLGNGKV